MTVNLIQNKDYEKIPEISGGTFYKNLFDMSRQLSPAILYLMDSDGDLINPSNSVGNLLINITNPDKYHPIEQIFLDSSFIDGTNLYVSLNRIKNETNNYYFRFMLWEYIADENKMILSN